MTGLRQYHLAVFLLGLFVFASSGCGKGDSAAPAASIDGTATPGGATVVTESRDNTANTPAAAPRKMQVVNLYPEVLIKTSAGEIRVKLNAKQAPITVENFLDSYVDREFYPGTIFHYVDKSSMIAAGGFTEKYEAKDVRAPILNEATNGLLNKRGTIAMIRDPQYSQSATSQFYFNLVDNAALDHKSIDSSEEYGYCVFGEVVSGMEVVDAIANAEVHDQGDFVSTPVQPVVIESIQRVK